MAPCGAFEELTPKLTLTLTLLEQRTILVKIFPQKKMTYMAPCGASEELTPKFTITLTLSEQRTVLVELFLQKT